MEPLHYDTPLDAPEPENQEKKRHGCVTAWLILMIVANSIFALVYFFAQGMMTDAMPHIPTYIFLVLGFLTLCNVGCAILLLQWKRLGFWGFIATAAVAFVINITYNIGGVGTHISALVGIAILYGILQIRERNVSAWDNME
jgi:hypothetical protein